VANFAHVGGGVAGLFLCMAMRQKRDTEAVSDAKAIQADMNGDLSLAPLYSLIAMAEDDPQNPDALRALIASAMRQHSQGAIEKAFAQAGPSLIETQPALVAYYLLDLQGSGSAYKPMHLLRLAGLLEQSGETQKAIRVRKLVVDRFGTEADAETALYRMAQCAWKAHRDAQTARSCLSEMAERFPRGQMTPYGQILWQQIEQSATGGTGRRPAR